MPQSDPAIRHAEADDRFALEILIGQLGYEVSADEIAARIPLLTAPGSRMLVAELEGRVVGCLTTSMMRVVHRPAPVGRISMMVVEAGLRGKGVGKALVRAAEAALAADGCRMVEVTSNVARTEAHKFYQALGYERTSVRLARELAPPPPG
jgi:GNAT superfamily N-acetyltransferase